MSKKIMQKLFYKAADDFSVGIIGCGWLGKALAVTLLESNICVLATSSKLDNVEKLNRQGINTQQLILPAMSEQLFQHAIFTQQSLVIAITPQFKLGRTDYADKVSKLVSAAQKRGIVQHIILISSTAVYHGLEGNIDEDNQLNLATEKVQILNAAEQSVLNFSKVSSESSFKSLSKQASVIRLAGLVGPDRHPGKFLLPNKVRGNKALTNAMSPVNLIHQQDAVGIIVAMLRDKSPRGLFNGVSDTHVSKQQYYQIAAQALGLEPPVFLRQQSNKTTRIVSGEKAKQVLSYKFIYPDLLTWL